ncbi:MAG: hypothetical protein K8H88_04985, partial [Sandaracinaceae bacterium]|nr:hypothetical protein [Sandaracinaceae bacterium]
QYRTTSVAGEVIAAAAEAQAEAGDWAGAIESYDQAFDAFRRHDAAVPPEIACAAASLMLRTATDQEARERAAQRADLCFRTSVPGDPRRNDVRRAIARLRFEGLDLAAFDQSEPATRFFTQQPSRPTVDAVQVSLEMPDLERPTRSHEQVREVLDGEAGRRAVAECFIQDWETRHERSGTASLVLRYSTRMRDMGTYDLYEPVIEVNKTVESEDGFEPCLARSLGALFDSQSRNFRGEPWNQAVRVMARIQ